MIILHCQNLHKHFANKKVLCGIDLEISEGEIFGLLGTNGVGKSTFIKCILQLIRPSEGQILYRGETLKNQNIEQDFGFLPENFFPYGNLTAPELLNILAWGKGIPRSRVEELLEQLHLAPHQKLRIKNYSRGMIQRLGLALSLVKKPRILILDEPSLGLDVVGQQQMMDFLVQLNKAQTTIFFTSHILTHVQSLCQRIGVLHHGKLSYVGKVTDFLQKHQSPSLETAFLHEIGEKS